MTNSPPSSPPSSSFAWQAPPQKSRRRPSLPHRRRVHQLRCHPRHRRTSRQRLRAGRCSRLNRSPSSHGGSTARPRSTQRRRPRSPLQRRRGRNTDSSFARSSNHAPPRCATDKAASLRSPALRCVLACAAPPRGDSSKAWRCCAWQTRWAPATYCGAPQPRRGSSRARWAARRRKRYSTSCSRSSTRRPHSPTRTLCAPGAARRRRPEAASRTPLGACAPAQCRGPTRCERCSRTTAPRRTSPTTSRGYCPTPLPPLR